MKDYDYITKQLNQSIDGGNISELYITIQPKRKEATQVSVSLEVMKRFPIKDIEDAKKLYEEIQKFSYNLEEIVYGNKKKK